MSEVNEPLPDQDDVSDDGAEQPEIQPVPAEIDDGWVEA